MTCLCCMTNSESEYLSVCLTKSWCTGDESWLKEADMDFFARGPSETADAVTDAASSAVVQV